ncbi:hypothetical protein [Natronolimnobius baerhuensis]|uniref:hypothetical protein n=1 Tax=Natronolimnobius baerhuensis TaxID=253108 RepID=UPI0011250470|nr:hypothetical protein [Natronolimnobius baerhuensis]
MTLESLSQWVPERPRDRSVRAVAANDRVLEALRSTVGGRIERTRLQCRMFPIVDRAISTSSGVLTVVAWQ